MDLLPIQIHLRLIVTADFQNQSSLISFTLDITDRVGDVPLGQRSRELIEIDQVILLLHGAPDALESTHLDSFTGTWTELGFLQNLFLVQRRSAVSAFKGYGGEHKPLLERSSILRAQGPVALGSLRGCLLVFEPGGHLEIPRLSGSCSSRGSLFVCQPASHLLGSRRLPHLGRAIRAAGDNPLGVRGNGYTPDQIGRAHV